MKKWWIGLVVLVSVGLVGCGNQGAKQAVEAVYAYNHEEITDVDDFRYYDQKKSNAYVYEDQNNYYVLLKTQDIDDNEHVRSSVGRVGKHNQKVDFDHVPLPNEELYFVEQWYNQNKKPIYEEVHVDLSAYE